MFDKDLWQEIISALKKNKLRTLLTAFGVFWGILMLIIMVGAGNGLSNGVTKGFGDFATNSFFIWNQRTSLPYKGFSPGRWIQMTNSDVKYIRENVKEIKYLAPRIMVESWNGDVGLIMHGQKSGTFELDGEYPDLNQMDPRNIVKGRFINYLDLFENRKVAVIGPAVVTALFDRGEEPLGKYIQIRGVYIQVIGIAESKHSGGWGDNQNKSVILPFTTMQRVYNYGEHVSSIGITSVDEVPATVLEEKVKTIIKQRHDIAPDDVQAIGSFNLEKQVKQMSGLFIAINVLIWIVGIGTLLAGIIGVSNIMLVIVRERTREIGIQRAIGATPFQIIRQIVMESVCLTTIAGYTALVIGVGLVETVNFFLVKSGAKTGMFSNPEVNFNVAVTALMILIISGMFAGLIPAKHALRIKPVDALRYE